MTDNNFQGCKLLLAFSNYSDFNDIYVIRHSVAYIVLRSNQNMRRADPYARLHFKRHGHGMGKSQIT